LLDMTLVLSSSSKLGMGCNIALSVLVTEFTCGIFLES
jgi:hypothetical protein